MNDHMWQGCATGEMWAIDLCALLAFENSITALTNERQRWTEDSSELGNRGRNAKVTMKEQKQNRLISERLGGNLCSIKMYADIGIDVGADIGADKWRPWLHLFFCMHMCITISYIF